MSNFTFNGVSSVDMGLVMKRMPIIELPMKKIEKVNIPSRNGELYVDSGGYENITISIECYIVYSSSNTTTMNSELKRMFMNRQGKLVLSDYKDRYYEAYLVNTIDISRITGGLSECVLTFECYPFAKDAKAGATVIDMEEVGGGPSVNPNMFSIGSGNYQSEGEARALWYAPTFNTPLNKTTNEYYIEVPSSEFNISFDAVQSMNGLSIEAGKTYTVSFDAKASVRQPYQCSFYNFDASAPIHYNQNVEINTAWGRVSYTFTALEASSTQKWFIYPNGATVSITNLKIEEGTEDTGWNNGVIPPYNPDTIGQAVFNNKGDIQCNPTFTLTSNVARTVSMTVNEQMVEFRNVMGTLVIDSELTVATLDGANCAHLMIGQFPVFETGLNNIIINNAHSAEFTVEMQYI